MKIAQVCPYDIDRPGGVQMHIRDTAAAFMALGHEVTIIAPKVEASGNREGLWGPPALNIHRIGTARKIRMGATGFEMGMARGAELAALDALMRESQFDVVHYHTMWTPLLPYQVFRRSRAANVATFHDTTAKTSMGRAMRATFRLISRRLLPHLDAVIAVSDGPMENLSAAKGVHVEIVPPCTDLRRFAAAPQGPRHYADGRVNILFIGRLEQRKGVGLLVKAYRRLCQDGLSVRLIIAGTGKEEASLRQTIAANQIPDIVLTGEFTLAQTPGWFAEADIVCAPSPYGESFGIVVAEAMASGKPVVAAANVGYRTILKDQAAQCLVTPGDAEALYRGLKPLIQDQVARARLGAWGRADALHYDCRSVAPRLLAIYEAAMVKGRSRRRQTAPAG
jgi:phosphatidylinositol alpha-mannosyltransferase